MGCGDGINSTYLYNKGYDVIASDFSENALNIVRSENTNISTVCFDMTNNFPFPNEFFDVIIASLSTHYFFMEETQKIYARIWDKLKLGGSLIFRVNSYSELENNKRVDVIKLIEKDFYLSSNGKTKRYFSVETMKLLLEDTNFLVIYIENVEFKYNNRVKYAIEGIAIK